MEKTWIHIPREDIRGRQGRPEMWSGGVPEGVASLAGRKRKIGIEEGLVGRVGHA